ncbi:hypothetical protein [Nocardia asteroides]|uniref:hypothetical protein n=1 Tax=Nocardia asteroides TaxID=1824 RepID=UPI001E2FC90B|nr:hypothetical protein [Nocardia asteroides]UGT60091.1 hypothetical protein LTT61_23145 [Nocardia asteroides]
MSQSVEIDPDGVRRAAAGFEEVANTTQHILDTLSHACSSKGEPWGDDKAGNQFAEGEKGYRVNRDGVFDTLSQLVGVFQANATNLRDAALTFEVNEEQVAGGR